MLIRVLKGCRRHEIGNVRIGRGAAPAAILATALLGLAGCQTAPRNIIASFATPEELRGLVIIVPVTVQGKEYSFLLDTGCSGLVFDESLRPVLGPKLGETTFKSISGESNTSYYNAPDARLGVISLKACGHVVCINLEHLRATTGWDIRGLVGMSVLREYVVQIDEKGVNLASSDSAWHPEWGSAVRMSPDANRPRIPATVNNTLEVMLLTDTGFSGLIDLADSSGLKMDGNTGKGPDYVVGPTVIAKNRGTARALVSLVAEGLFSQNAYDWHSDITVAGDSAIGLPVMLLFRPVTFDFPNGKMYLSNPRGLELLTRCGHPGFWFVRGEEGLVITCVSEEARVGGPRVGDVILSVNEKDVTRMQSWEAARCFWFDANDPSKSRSVKVRVRRNGQVVDLDANCQRAGVRLYTK
jgi:hypothetical protein